MGANLKDIIMLGHDGKLKVGNYNDELKTTKFKKINNDNILSLLAITHSNVNIINRLTLLQQKGTKRKGRKTKRRKGRKTKRTKGRKGRKTKRRK
tara:strand:- start:1593 stop:1877 length:285 start_codon:yes stop_codon:yes gene_type:complete